MFLSNLTPEQKRLMLSLWASMIQDFMLFHHFASFWGTGWARREGNREEKGPTDVLLWHLPCLRPGLARQAATETRQDRNFWQHVQLHQILPERQINAGQVEGSHVDHQGSKYGRSSGISDRPPVVQHHGPRRGHGSEGKGSADHVRRRLGDMDGHPHQTSPHKQLVCETKHETIPGSCGRGGPLYASKWIRSLFPENGVRPFHTNTSQNTEVHIRVNGQSIFASKEVKYLSVHFTRWGRTNQQVAHNVRNASWALNVIKVLSAQPWANTPKILVTVMRALVRSRLSYGLEAMPHLAKRV